MVSCFSWQPVSFFALAQFFRCDYHRNGSADGYAEGYRTASATIGVTGREGKLIKLNVSPMLIDTLATIMIIMVVIFVLGLQP